MLNSAAALNESDLLLSKIITQEKLFVPTHHHLFQLKYKFITTLTITKDNAALLDLKAKFCQELLPVIDRLESNGGSYMKGKVLSEFAKVKLNMLERELKNNVLTREEYMKQVKPYLGLQMKACQMINVFMNKSMGK